MKIAVLPMVADGYKRRKLQSEQCGIMYLYPTANAAEALGVTPETLRSWRRRSMGPPYIKQPGGYIRSRSGLTIESPDGRLSVRIGGKLHWCDSKPNGSIYYPEDKLLAFVDARTVPRGARFLPRPFPGRLPGGGNRKDIAAPSVGAAADGSGGPARRDAPAATDGCGGSGGRVRRTDVTGLRLFPTIVAALWLGVLPDTLRAWRRRGIGPAYVRLPGGRVRRGKPQGRIGYPAEELQAFAKVWLVSRGGALEPRPYPMPRPVPRNRAG